MTKKILLFLTFPLFIFGTIEIATKNIDKKEASKEKLTDKQEAEKSISLGPYKQQKSTENKPAANNTKNTLSDDPNNDFIRPEPTTAPFLETGYQKQFFKTLIFICVLILFALIVIFIYRRASPMSKITKRNSRNNIKILERRSLSPQTYLYHIQVGDKQFILSESKVDVRNVATLDWLNGK